MDPFTQRMLEKAEQRSRALGISSAGKFALSECNMDGNANSGVDATSVVQQQKPQQQTQSLQQQYKQQEQSTFRAPPTSAHASTNTTSRSADSAAATGGGAGGNSGNNKLQVVEKTLPDAMNATCNTQNKVLRQFSAVDKENMDLGIEINIMTDKHVEVQVQVEEQEVTEEDSRGHSQDSADHPLAKIRDTSRNRLQRLGALYANPNDLSSPIHRTEGKFHADSPDDAALEKSSKRPKQRYGKLVALANSINQWEDDTSHHHNPMSAVPPPKPDLPSRKVAAGVPRKGPAPAPPTTAATREKVTTEKITAGRERDGVNNAVPTKQLTWDPQVINSLEAQGFQRRESTTVKLAYDYSKDNEEKEKEKDKEQIQPNTTQTLNDKPKIGKLAYVFTNMNSCSEEKKPHGNERKIPAVKPGLVSGRTAAFESKVSANQQCQRPQKDPTELSLKERMQLFERNKGEALIPKAPLGMAPSINQIRQDSAAVLRKDDALKAATNALNAATTSAFAPKPSGESKLRDKVAALVATATTISENKIKAEIQKQRQEDMQILANRFNKQKNVFANGELQPPQQQQQQLQPKQQQQAQPKQQTKTIPKLHDVAMKHPPTPPPPPPMPKAPLAANNKRRSPGDAIDDDESKRARKSATIVSRPGAAVSRLYPALSDLESTESLSDNDNCGTTATMSGRSTADEQLEKKVVHGRGSVNARAQTVGDVDADADDDENESYMDSEEADDSSVGICNGSLGREIMQVVKKNDNQQQHQQQQIKPVKEVRYADKDDYYGGGGNGYDSSINSSEASLGMDDYLDEALDDGDDDYTQGSAEDAEDVENTSRASKESKGTTASNSFSFRKTPKKYTNYQTISEEQDDFQTPNAVDSTYTQPVKSELSVNREDDNMVTLVHTVSFYRRQQTTNSANSTPVRKVCREQQVHRSDVGNAACAAMQIDSPKQHAQLELSADPEETYSDDDVDDSPSDTDVDDTLLVQEKIKKLLDEVCKQQQVIAQTSQALNLCAATIEFSGSTESVEGERHLLVATHRRQACLDEVQRLRVEKSLRPVGAPREKGRLTVKEITIPLRQDYIRKLAADTISGHHLVCLLKYNEHVLATKTVPTLPGLLAVKFPDVLQLNNVFADFRITLEIYGMTAQREVLPHEVKYHINLNKKSGIKTPKKKGDNRLVMPPVQSPAGPNVVRTPALVQYGFAIFSLREIQRTSWTLTQVLGVSPLEGVVHMKVNCELSVNVEHKGFLTMFEDISGFGAWHRRWCYLNGTVLNYWKYPDDEKKKAPIGSIDLYACFTQKVNVAPRDICARLNTMLLECQRPAKDTDEESLIIVPNGRTTIVRHLLSADTKEEREQWCAYFNKAMTLLRAWGSPQ